MKLFILKLFQQCAWALSIFCIFALGMEWLIPDSVTPYLHLLPYAIVAIVFLCIDAIFLHERTTLAERVVTGVAIGLLATAMVLSYREPGMANMLAIGLMIVMLAVSGFFLMKWED